MLDFKLISGFIILKKIQISYSKDTVEMNYGTILEK